MITAAPRRRAVSACLALALGCVCGGCRSHAALARLALTKAEKQARAVSDPELLATIGTAWTTVDPKRGHDVLRDAWNLALAPKRFEADDRAVLIVKLAPAWAFTSRTPASAAAILRQALDVVESIKPGFESNLYAFTHEQDERVRLIASLAAVAPDDAIKRARRLPAGYRESALRDIALAVAPCDWQRARELMAAAVAPGSALARGADAGWAELAQARVRANPQEAVALAVSKVRSARLRAAVLLQAVDALVRKDRPVAERMIREERDANARAWAWITLAHESKGAARESAIRLAVEAIKGEGLFAGRDSQRVTQWSLLAVLVSARSQAREYFAAAEAAQSHPPTVGQQGVITAATSYIEPPKAVAIYRKLVAQRRAGPNRRDANTALLIVGDMVAATDLQLVIRAMRDTPEWSGVCAPVALADMASNPLARGDREEAAKFIAAAQKALAAAERAARRSKETYAAQSSRLQGMEELARVLAESGNINEALKLAGQIDDARTAAGTYAAIAYAIERKPVRPPDLFSRLWYAAHLGLLSGDPNIAPPWIPR